VRVLILGANGFIGSALCKRILADTDWEIEAVDVAVDRLVDLECSRCVAMTGDIRNWRDKWVLGADVVLPLAAIATPKTYITDPLKVFELDFEANLKIIRACAEYKKRLIFPSSSEVYGTTPGAAKEYETPLTYGPTHKTRWIYACSKQLLDRVIHALGDEGLKYTIFRPFNWIGPGLDSLEAPRIGSSRVVTEFIGNILRGEPMRLVDGGYQCRSFCWIDDGITALMQILRGGGRLDGHIFNIGNPANEASMMELAVLLNGISGKNVPIERVTPEEFYGDGYEDIERRVADIDLARRLLDWQPKVGLEDALRRTWEGMVNAL